MRLEQRMFAPGEILYCPELLYVEVTHTFRRYVFNRSVAVLRAEAALRDLLDLRVNHFPHGLVITRVWELRNSLTAYDAMYVAMAETLDAPLITCDRKIASAPGHHAQVELF